MAKYVLCMNSNPVKMNEVIWAKKDFNHCKPYDLESIDGFCMSFEDEERIKKHLMEIAVADYQEGHIDKLPSFPNQLNIRYMSKKAIRTLSYGLPYSKDKKYFDYEYLRAHLQSLRSNATFLNRLASSFCGSPIQASNTALFREVANYLKNGRSYPDENRFYQAMADFISIELFKYDKDAHEYKTDSKGNLIYKWRQLHDLAMFTLNFDRQQEKPKKEATPPTTETEAGKQKILTGVQMSLFDL